MVTGMTFESFHKSFEVCLLHRLDFRRELSLSLFNGFGADHFTELVDSARSEEHVLGTDKDRCPVRRVLQLSVRLAGVSALVRTPSALYLSASFMILPK